MGRSVFCPAMHHRAIGECGACQRSTVAFLLQQRVFIFSVSIETTRYVTRQIEGFHTALNPTISIMQCAPSRRFSGQFLRRCFSSSARRLEIRDVSALSQRLVPKYRGQFLLPRDMIPDANLFFLTRNPRRAASFSTMAGTAAEHSSGAERLRSSSNRLTD